MNIILPLLALLVPLIFAILALWEPCDSPREMTKDLQDNDTVTVFNDVIYDGVFIEGDSIIIHGIQTSTSTDTVLVLHRSAKP